MGYLWKIIEKQKKKYKIQTRQFTETSHVVMTIYAQLSHALSLNDICDCLAFHKGAPCPNRELYTPSGSNGLAYAAALAEELFRTVFDEINGKHPRI